MKYHWMPQFGFFTATNSDGLTYRYTGDPEVIEDFRQYLRYLKRGEWPRSIAQVNEVTEGRFSRKVVIGGGD